MGKLKMAAVVATGILFMVLACVFGVQGSRNKAIDLEQAVEMAESDIHVQEKRRFDLLPNLADAILRMHTLPFQRLQKHTRS